MHKSLDFLKTSKKDSRRREDFLSSSQKKFQDNLDKPSSVKFPSELMTGSSIDALPSVPISSGKPTFTVHTSSKPNEAKKGNNVAQLDSLVKRIVQDGQFTNPFESQRKEISDKVAQPETSSFQTDAKQVIPSHILAELESSGAKTFGGGLFAPLSLVYFSYGERLILWNFETQSKTIFKDAKYPIADVLFIRNTLKHPTLTVIY